MIHMNKNKTVCAQMGKGATVCFLLCFAGSKIYFSSTSMMEFEKKKKKISGNGARG